MMMKSEMTSVLWRAVLTVSLVGSIAATAAAVQPELDQELLTREEQAFQEAVALVSPTLVRIETVGGREVVESQLTSTAASTGVAVSADGYIVTSSYHFLSEPSSIIVQLADGRRFPAKQVSQDEVLNVTLLKIEVADLIVPPAAEKESIRVGQWALALGKTYSSEVPNLSVGIVSALNRVWGKAIVQTDAKISPVNYGGPLIDIHGQVMGILVPLSPQDNSVQAGTDWYDSGIGFAASFTRIQQNLEVMKTGKDLKKGLLGVMMAQEELLGSPAKVEKVRFASPAEEAGIEDGAVITQINDQPINTKDDFKFAVGPLYAGDKVRVSFSIDGETRNVEATLVEELVPYEAGFLGVLTARKAIDSDEQGVGIRYIYPESPAASGGLQRGDRIIEFNKEPIETQDQLEGAIGLQIVDDEVDLVVLRDGERQELSVKLASKVETALPEELGPALVPALEADQLPEGMPERGRITEEVEELKHKYWAYVPDDYNPNYPYSLLVWIHPAGKPLEAPILKAFREECNRRGIILLAPLANEQAGWSNEEFEFIAELIQMFNQRYRIAQGRTVVVSSEDSSRFTTQFAFRQPEQIAGLALFNSLMRSRPPEPEPGLDFSFFFGASSDFPAIPQLEQLASKLREMKLEAQLQKSSAEQSDVFPADLIKRLSVWIDSLDRI